MEQATAKNQIRTELRTMQDKYTYFLLAVAASAIALSIQITKEDTLTFSLIPLGIAVVLWAGSFFSGCRYIQYVQSTLFANHEYFLIKDGEHPFVGNHPGSIAAASEGIKSAMEHNINSASLYSRWQFRLLVSGGIFYIIWHILEMSIRTLSQN